MLAAMCSPGITTTSWRSARRRAASAVTSSRWQHTERALLPGKRALVVGAHGTADAVGGRRDRPGQRGNVLLLARGNAHGCL